MAKIKVESQSTGTGIYTLKTGAASTNYSATLPDATGTLLMADGDGSSLSGVGGGKILQVVQATPTNTMVEHTGSGTWVDVGPSVTITPASGSKVLIYHHSPGFGDGFGFGYFRMVRDSDSTTLRYLNSQGYHTAAMADSQVFTWGGWYLDSSPGGDGSTAITYSFDIQATVSGNLRHGFNSGNTNGNISMAIEIGA